MAGNGASTEFEDLEVEINESLTQKLKSSGNISWGFILGRVSLSYVDILNVYNAGHIEIYDEEVRPSESDKAAVGKIQTLMNEILTNIPNGIDIIGIYYNNDLREDRVTQFASDVLMPILAEELPEFDSYADKFLICKVRRENEDLEVAFLEAIIAGDDSEFPRVCIHHSKLLEDKFFGSTFCVRARCTIPCQLSTVDLDESIRQESARISSKLKESQLALNIQSSDTLLLPEDLDQETVEEFLGQDIIAGGNDVIDIEVLLSMSSDTNKGSEIYSPFLICNMTVDEIVKFTLHLDAMLYVNKSSTASSFLQKVRNSLCIQSKHILFSMAELQQKFGICKLEMFHFKPIGMKHLVSTVYPVCKLDGSKISDVDLLEKRKHLHNVWMLPADKPTFKGSQGYFTKLPSSHLLNPHNGLKSGIDEGISVTVDGRYAYHHYMQDRFDDNGWGCAYRSLQTICSWFKLQGYTTENVPGHKQIQEALVKVGDKPKSFIGSKQWIGSFEVSICLREITQVDSKILHVPSGAEMAFKGRELIEHFRTQGTPVMIGGGVLAHTIIGVHFNESTGDIKFLILDPHYTGGEDLKTVQGKGWCGWKGPKFWDQSAHYNMCLPQRPIVF